MTIPHWLHFALTVQTRQLATPKRLMEQGFGPIDAAEVAQGAFDVRQAAQRALRARVEACLGARIPVVLPADPFRPYRAPSAQEPVLLILGMDWGREP